MFSPCRAKCQPLASVGVLDLCWCCWYVVSEKHAALTAGNTLMSIKHLLQVRKDKMGKGAKRVCILCQVKHLLLCDLQDYNAMVTGL